MTIYQGNNITVKWDIYKSPTLIHEDWTNATLRVFLIGLKDKYCIDSEHCTVNSSNQIVLDLGDELAVDVYSLKAVWTKNEYEKDHPLFNTRAIHESIVEYAFAVTDNLSEDDDVKAEDVTLSVKSEVNSFGYDGLSAWELAWFKGLTTLSEKEWVQDNATMQANESSRAEAETARVKEWSGYKDQIEAEIDNAQEQGDYAKKQGDYAKEQGNEAKAQAKAAKDGASEAEAWAYEAEQAANNAQAVADEWNNTLKNQVETARKNANDAAYNADTAREQAVIKGDYAQAQGELAVKKGDIAQSAADAATAKIAELDTYKSDLDKEVADRKSADSALRMDLDYGMSSITTLNVNVNNILNRESEYTQIKTYTLMGILKSYTPQQKYAVWQAIKAVSDKHIIMQYTTGYWVRVEITQDAHYSFWYNDKYYQFYFTETGTSTGVTNAEVVIEYNGISVTELEKDSEDHGAKITQLTANEGELEDLQTAVKANLVAAINEARLSGSGGTGGKAMTVAGTTLVISSQDGSTKVEDHVLIFG